MSTKRPHMPMAVKLNAALIALGLDPASVEWHHEPGLALRPYDAATGKWTPDANDPRHIVPMGRAAHRERTPRDITAAAKTKRLTKGQELFIALMLSKDGLADKPRDVRRSRIPSRPFQKRPAKAHP